MTRRSAIFSPGTRIRLTEKVRRLFGGNPRWVQAAALPWREGGRAGGIEILLVTSRDTGRWVLPKGWPEGRETLWQTARREALEEAGIEGDTADEEIGRFYYTKLRGSGVESPCEVAIVPMRVKRQLSEWPERKKRRRQWYAPRTAARLVNEPDLAELILRFADNPREIAA